MSWGQKKLCTTILNPAGPTANQPSPPRPSPVPKPPSRKTTGMMTTGGAFFRHHRSPSSVNNRDDGDRQCLLPPPSSSLPFISRASPPSWRTTNRADGGSPFTDEPAPCRLCLPPTAARLSSPGR
ncbi:unnamed protein product, partial [Heterosigma akashiwo]